NAAVVEATGIVRRKRRERGPRIGDEGNAGTLPGWGYFLAVGFLSAFPWRVRGSFIRLLCSWRPNGLSGSAGQRPGTVCVHRVRILSADGDFDCAVPDKRRPPLQRFISRALRRPHRAALHLRRT